jgi:hypothetical protein
VAGEGRGVEEGRRMREGGQRGRLGRAGGVLKHSRACVQSDLVPWLLCWWEA